VTSLSHTSRVAGTRKQLTYIAIAALVALLVTAAIVLPLTLTGSSSSRPAAVARPTAHSVPLIQYRGNGEAPEPSGSAVTHTGQSHVLDLRSNPFRGGMIPNWR
jgi:hypothetical protein